MCVCVLCQQSIALKAIIGINLFSILIAQEKSVYFSNFIYLEINDCKRKVYFYSGSNVLLLFSIILFFECMKMYYNCLKLGIVVEILLRFFFNCSFNNFDYRIFLKQVLKQMMPVLRGF